MATEYQTEIVIPDYYFPSISVEGNRVERFAHESIKTVATVHSTAIKHAVLVETELSAPFNRFYVIKKRGIELSTLDQLPVLRTKHEKQFLSLNLQSELVWEANPYDQIGDMTPRQISTSWVNKFSFRSEDNELEIKGLRPPQIGALHAISAEFSRDRDIEPCTVVLPTGTGKTETMISTAVYHRCETVLVLVPSNSLRDQIGSKFERLGCLVELGVVDCDVTYPSVTKITKGIKKVEDALKILNKSNVLIATPQILNSKHSNPDVLNALCNGYSHLFVDEAHHISAKKWNEIKEKFEGKRVIQFTATPFRNDTTSLGAKIIYNYTMGEAQKAGYFKSINLEPIEEYFQEEMDEAIARKALEVLCRDMQDFDHLMMARVSSKERAKQIFSIYHRLAPELKPILVHSDLSKTIQAERLELLRNQSSKIVVCVDMLGEGYDLPNLKIAAIHDHHKSLAITLQFIGRFTRVSHKEKLSNATVVVNIADPGVEGALQKLYALGADWDSVLRRLSENQIEREVRLQEVVDSLKSDGDLYKQLSLWNLRPSCSAMLFKTDCKFWTPERFVELSLSSDETWHSISNEENILVVLAVNSTGVKWGNFKDLKDINYKILIAHWDINRQGLFVFSNDYKGFKVEKLADLICGGSTEVMSGKQIFNVLNNIEYPLVTNLGSAQNGAISFTQFFGPNVTEGLSSVEKSASTLSNIAAIGYEEGNKVLWGCSERKGKVWSPQAGSISDWLGWVTAAWDKVVSSDVDEANITRDFLRPTRIVTPHKYKPVSSQWGEHLQQRFDDNVRIYFGKDFYYLYEVDLKVDWNEVDQSPILIFESGNFCSKYKLKIDGDLPKGYDYEHVDGHEITIQLGNSDPVSLADEMLKDPIFIYYSDGSFSYNCFWVEVKDNIGEYDSEKLRTIDWTVNITNESMGKEEKQDSIQYETWKLVEDEYDVIVNDDGSGEAADLVALKSLQEKIVLSLFHCKYSHGEEPGRRLSDLYEVCGQAQRSVRWKHVGLPYFYKHIRKREALWVKENHSRFLKGSISILENIKNRARTTPVELQVTIVQPGLSKKAVTEEMLKLLGTTELFIKKTTMADLNVWCSD